MQEAFLLELEEGDVDAGLEGRALRHAQPVLLDEDGRGRRLRRAVLHFRVAVDQVVKDERVPAHTQPGNVPLYSRGWCWPKTYLYFERNRLALIEERRR